MLHHMRSYHLALIIIMKGPKEVILTQEGPREISEVTNSDSMLCKKGEM